MARGGPPGQGDLTAQPGSGVFGLVQSLAAGHGEAEVTVSLVAGPDRQTTEHLEKIATTVLAAPGPKASTSPKRGR